MIRIVGGVHRGRRLRVPEGKDVRPTADRVREAIFNILAHAGLGPGGVSPIAGARVLDLFCGTGAMALEALSRGAERATLVDADRASLEIARRNAEAVDEDERATLLLRDATEPPPRGSGGITLAFLDPPYGSGLAPNALAAWRPALAEGAVVVVELARKEAFAPPAGFEPLDERAYGAARVVLLRRTAAA